MSLDWFEFHPKSFLTDTMRLNTEAKGAYLLLLLDYYEKEGPAPDDDDVLAAITGLQLETWQRHRKVIQTLFQIDSGLWRHMTCESVIADAKARIARQSSAGKKAARVRWNNSKTIDGTATRIRDGMRTASETDTGRNATAEANFGPSVPIASEPDTNRTADRIETAPNMPIASEAQCDSHAERYAIEMHSNSNKERREGANAPSLASEVSIGSLIDPAFMPLPAACEQARSDGVIREMAGWLDEWKARCEAEGTRVTNWHEAWDREYHRRMQERAKARPKPKVSVSKKQRLTKLPDDWKPNETHDRIASERNLALGLCVESFSDYILTKQPDWRDADAAFRNWLKSPHRTEFKRNGQAPQRRAPAPTTGGSILDAGARFEQRLSALASGAGAPGEDQPDGDAAVLSVSEE